MRKQKRKAPHVIKGTISVHPKGFGFVRAEEGPDIFIPKKGMLGAVDGDTVEVEVNPLLSIKGPEGIIVSIVKRSKTHLAAVVMGKTKNHYTAYAPLLGADKPVLLKAKKKLEPGDRVLCKVSDWNAKHDWVEGTLDQYLGHISDPSIDTTAAIEEFAIPSAFQKETLEEAKSFGKKVPDAEIKKRLDLREEETVTIDPKTARDFDDAISLREDASGHFHLGVHIADVVHYVKRGSFLDREARERCNSVYFPGTCVPMLPEALSNELCSLKPNVTRLTQSVLAVFDKEGNLLDVSIERTAIESKCRFSYEDAFRVLEGKEKSPHLPLLERMVRLCHLLKKKRFERGSIDFAMPEDVIEVDASGTPIKITRVEYDITHQMIEEFMLKANELIAIHLNNQGKSLIYRVHEEPSKDSFEDFYSFARALGFFLPPTPNHIDIQNLFIKAKGSPYLEQLSVSFIRSMRLAQYSPDNIGHYGLALEHYCHFTSPIRRYTDLIIQRLLFEGETVDENLETIALACSEKERVASMAENALVLLKKLRLAKTKFEENPKAIYKATITRIKPFALFFEVSAFDLESSLHISEIGGDFYEFSPTKMSFRGTRTGKNFSIGQTISVQLQEINLILRTSAWRMA